MKKVVCFGLCFLIVLCSFVLSFATVSDEPSPFFIPYSTIDNPTGGFLVTSPEPRYIYSDSSSPVYGVFYQISSYPTRSYYVYFSEVPCTVSIYRVQGEDLRTVNLSNEYNGFYYSSFYGFIPDNVPIFSNPDDLSATGIIDLVNSSFFMTTFDLSTLVDGSGQWVSSLANAVLEQPLLLFLILSIFVGIGIGLFNRFRR